MSKFLLPRRSIIKAGAAFVASAPFIARSPYANALVLGGAQAPSAPVGDALTALVAGMTPGTWKTAGTNTLANVAPTGLGLGTTGNVMDPWSGATYDSVHKQLIIWGGGHTDYYGNEVYVFDCPTLTWQLLCRPSAYPAGIFNPMSPSGDGNFQDGAGEAVMLDGNPAPEHSYQSLAYDPVSLLLRANAGGRAGGGSGSAHVWTFNTTTQNPANIGVWTRLGSDNISNLGNTGMIFCYDSGQDVFWYYTGQSSSHTMQFFNRSTWTQKGVTDWGFQGQGGAIDLVHKRAYAIGKDELSASTITAYFSTDIAGGTWGNLTTPTTTGDKTIENDPYPGAVYYPPTGDIVCWRGASKPGTPNVWRLNTTTHAWTVQTPAGGNLVTPSNAAFAGTFGRWQYLSSYGCFMLVNNQTQPVYIYKPAF